MEVIKINQQRVESSAAVKIVECLRQGKVVVLPTDSSYAFCANALNGRAVNKVFLIKGRSRGKPLHVLVKNLAMAKTLCFFNQRAAALFRKCLPGKLTLVLPKKPVVPGVLTAGRRTLGLSLIDHPLIRMFFCLLDCPLTAPSPNLSDEQPFFDARALVKKFQARQHKPDLVVDAGRLKKSPASTVAELLPTGKVKVWRQGAVRISSKLKL